MLTAMFTDPIQIAEARARELGVAIEDVCREAGIHRTLWQKWKHGKHEPSMKSLRRLGEKLDDMAGAARRGTA